MSELILPVHLRKTRIVTLTKQDLIDFETEVKEIYEAGTINAPIHLSKNNEDQLINIFQYVNEKDWVLSGWRNHYHALLHGIPRDELLQDIVNGRSMSINDPGRRFYSSSIVAGILPIAVGLAKAIKLKGEDRKVWCFIGDMTFETGMFSEVYKYCENFNLPVQFVVEDNNMSTNTPTDEAWGGKRHVDYDVVYYSYEREYPHHGTGNWVLF